MERIRARVFVEGRVQGVFYRQSTRSQAQGRGVKGWVRNLPDGRVEAVFEGDPGTVEALIDWCRSGPPGAAVELVEVSYEPADPPLDDFRIAD